MVYIYFSTHSGTSEGFAKMLQKEIHDASLTCEVHNINQLTPDKFKSQNNFIFLISTHYEGDCCTDMAQFYNWIRNDNGYDYLKGKKYTMFGLGDEDYEHFNRCSKTCQKYFQMNQMEEFFPYDVGSDHDDDIETDFLQWKDGLIDCIKKLNVSVQKQVKKDQIYILTNKYIDKNISNLQYSIQYKDLQSKKKMQLMSINESYYYSTDEHCTYDINFELQDKEGYQVAQNIVLHPKNNSQIVDEALQFFKLKGDEILDIQDLNQKKIPFAPGHTTKQILEEFLDLQGILKPSIYKAVAKLDQNNQNLQDLLKDKSMQKQYKDNYVGILEFIISQKVNISFELFCEICPLMKSRFFTISSSPQSNPQIIKILLKKEVKYKKNQQMWVGLFSRIITDAYQNKKHLTLSYSIQNSTFKIPKEKTDLLMICTGTGIAPFLGIIEEKMLNKGSNWGYLNLVFGCQDYTRDSINRDFIDKAINDGVLNEFHTVESRVQEEKVYVQNYLEKNLDMLQQYLQKNSKKRVYICGSLAMCQRVLEIIKQNAEEDFQELSNQERLCSEAWG